MKLDRELRDALTELHIQVEPAVLEALGRYYALLVRWNKRVRLVGSTAPEVVAVRHLADSLTLLELLAGERGRLLDMGAGAGLPGIPVALARPDLEVVMVEPDHRKAAFIKTAVAELALSRVRVLTVRAEGEAEAEGVGSGDVVVSRALMDPERWVPLAGRYVRDGGAVLAMMAAGAPSDAALEVLGRLQGLTLERVWRGALPKGEGTRVIARWRCGQAGA